MKTFEKESLVRQYKIDDLPFNVDLCFLVHKLVLEIDEDGRVYHDEIKRQLGQKFIEKLGFTFIIIPDLQSFE